jgi:hypothetical protein
LETKWDNRRWHKWLSTLKQLNYNYLNIFSYIFGVRWVRQASSIYFLSACLFDRRMLFLSHCYSLISFCLFLTVYKYFNINRIISL